MTKPNPGSEDARKLGCRCPIIDNGHGKGSRYRDDNGKQTFVINTRCPVHKPQKPEVEA